MAVRQIAVLIRRGEQDGGDHQRRGKECPHQTLQRDRHARPLRVTWRLASWFAARVSARSPAATARPPAPDYAPSWRTQRSDGIRCVVSFNSGDEDAPRPDDRGAYGAGSLPSTPANGVTPVRARR